MEVTSLRPRSGAAGEGRQNGVPAVIPRFLLAALLLPVALCSGCSALVKRPDTPAARLTTPGLLANSNRPNERYYIMLFGSQSTPRVPARSHTWATMVKVTDDPKGGPPAIESHTISWFPDSLNV